MTSVSTARRTESVLARPDDGYVRHVVRTHLHPETGSRYWLERDRRLGLDAYSRVETFEDLKRWVGFRDLEDQLDFERATRSRPVEDFIPASLLADRERWIWVSQTGGTTGPAKHGNWDSRYWRRILDFTDEFLDAHGIPRDVNWLFIGPMGPHTTGRLVVSIAEHRGGRCFSIDLDPRIVKIFGTEGMHEASDRYIRHIWDQVTAV
ncbi:MAG: AMP-dependent synthetase, partial [Acidobacteria bacterium]|nr:AMP-dependent synthetase [Acidobacteriota bacterium]